MHEPVVALLTSLEARGLDTDLPLLVAALEHLGATVRVEAWDDERVDWGGVDVAVVRSTWDYVGRLDEFLGRLAEIDAATALWNPLPVVRWNTDKRYVADLAASGVPTVPTRFVAPGDDPGPLDGGLVIKPTVGAGSKGASRFVDDPAGAAAHVRRLHASGATAMVQPYVEQIDDRGETGLVHVGGRFSHAFRKGPILRSPIEWEGGLYAREDISARTPTEAERAVADAALAVVADLHGPVAYARVDLVPGPEGPLVLEVELTEPSLFLHLDEGAPARAAAAFRSLAG
jgi:glutathione synthase/RimK-type ligase-like ATP-grasp enzyme